MNMFESSGALPSITDVGFKPFPVARQGANAVVAFQRLLSKGLDPRLIDAITVFVPTLNVALLSRPLAHDDRLSRLSNMGFQFACTALAPDMLYDPERTDRSGAALAEFARHVSVEPANDLETHLPDHWAARIAVNAGSDRFEETVIDTPFDHDASGLSQFLAGKWRRLLSAEDARALENVGGPVPDRHAVLWQMIERRVSMAARGSGPSRTTASEG
jgi:2-methylcitrate dehydratase PrpD